MNVLYIACIDELIKDSYACDRLYELLPPFRQDKINRIKSVKSKCQSVAAFILLMIALKDAGVILDINSDSMKNLIYFEDEYQKPHLFFNDKREIFFSLSHSENYVACAIGNGTIGCDIEKIKNKDNSKIIKKIYGENEKLFITNGIDDEDKTERFYRIWTLKESFCKYTGRGMKDIAEKFDISVYEINNVVQKISLTDYESAEFVEITDIPQYALSVCTDKASADLFEVRILNSIFEYLNMEK